MTHCINKRLIWNFELAPQGKILSFKKSSIEDPCPLKWEIRLFWRHDEIITLNTSDPLMFNLENYQTKHREDTYYLLPQENYNIKKRHDELFYKPLIKKAALALGFGAKIKIGEPEQESFLQELNQKIALAGKEISVKKEAFVYKFPIKPRIKLELARLEVLGGIYFSVCIEGKSLIWVETIAQSLLGKQVSCEYVTFLKTILQ